ncbi:hypothetical protein, partial [Paramagnetospirillum caucaseum]|uniref:hypothetical protein n=1 Tax=Paramagnetospirillum caucaseum TaxID=1244869 RepID=UPI00058D368D
VAVAGQDTVSAGQTGGTLILAAGPAIAVTTHAAGDSVTIAVDESALADLIGQGTAGLPTAAAMHAMAAALSA